MYIFNLDCKNKVDLQKIKPKYLYQRYSFNFTNSQFFDLKSSFHKCFYLVIYLLNII